MYFLAVPETLVAMCPPAQYRDFVNPDITAPVEL